MPRTTTAAMDAHLAGDLLTLAQCWKIKRRDNVVKCYTEHDEAITWDGDTYYPTGGGTPSEFSQSIGFGVDSQDLEAVFVAGGITAEDLRAGLYNYAQWWTFLINWADPVTCGIIKLGRGYIGEREIGEYSARLEMRSLTQVLATPIGTILTPECGASVGDARCKVGMTNYRYVAAVTSVASDKVFTASGLAWISEDGYFAYGKIVWSTGLNAGLTMQIEWSINTTGQVFLEEPMPYAIQVGDTGYAYAGCDRRLYTCQTKFGNVANFRGAPHLPGADSILTVSSNLAWTSY